VLLAMLVVYGALLAAIGPDARLPGSVWTVCVSGYVLKLQVSWSVRSV